MPQLLQHKRNSQLRLYTRLFRLKRFWQRFLNLIYPDSRAACLLCQRPMGEQQEHRQEQYEPRESEQAHTLQGVCLFCLQDARMFSYQSWRGSLHIYNGNDKDTVVPVLCAVTYEGIIRDTIRHWKYDGHIEFTGYLAHLIAETLHQSQKYAGSEWDVLTCVPTSPDRLKKRGYHHVALLAEDLSRQLEEPFEDLLLRRAVTSGSPGSSTPTGSVGSPGSTDGSDVIGPVVGDSGAGAFTQSQTAKSASQRRQSLKGQFALRQQLSDRLSVGVPPSGSPTQFVHSKTYADAAKKISYSDTRVHPLQGKRILLIDDVVTTGATLEACAKVLMDAGARQVICLAIAHVR